ncbi:MAG: hypothetical protein ACRDHZ_09965 [Ktedonobacteraceae bacterium]
MTLFITLAGCASAQYDAPTPLLKATNFVGVAIHSVTPYKITSYTQIRPSQAGRSNSSHDLLGHLKIIDYSCQNDWCLMVSAYPKVASAWESWKGNSSHRCSGTHKIVCDRSPWDKAFFELHASAVRLLGRPPLPLHARIILLPEGLGYHAAVAAQSSTYVPLEFAFPFPINLEEPGFPGQADHALIHAIATLGYEFQHVEYAAGQTYGPNRPLGAKSAKDEANSECWKLVAQAFLTRGTASGFAFKRATGLAMQIDRAITGKKSDFSDAAVSGPVSLRRHLGAYLLQRYPELADGTMITISPNDAGAAEQLVSYCQAFIRYSGNILQRPMPTSRIKLVPTSSR